jgi:hypothetical protein
MTGSIVMPARTSSATVRFGTVPESHDATLTPWPATGFASCETTVSSSR